MIGLFLVLLVSSVFGADNVSEWEIITSNDNKNHDLSLNNKIINNVAGIPEKSEIAEDLQDMLFGPTFTKFQDVLVAFQNAFGNKSPSTSSISPLMNDIKTSNFVFSSGSAYDSSSGSFSYSGIYQPVTIEVGLASELQTFPNSRPKIYFEVTNNMAQTTLLLFRCEDSRGIIFTTWPLKSWLGSGEKTVVTVTLWTKGITDNTFQDLVTLSAISVSSRWEKSAIVYVSSQRVPETIQPSISYELITDCLRVLVGSCQDATWTADINIRDADSGLLRISSNPTGIYFPYRYTTGTQSSVKAYYTSSCCQSRVTITATDIKLNIISKDINAYELRPWMIAVICVSAIILLAIIVGLIVWIVRKKQKGSVDLPVYRGGSTTNTTTA